MSTRENSPWPRLAGPRRNVPMAIVAAGAILGIGLLAAANLALVQRSYREYLHAGVAQSLLEEGRMLVRQLAGEPAVTSDSPRASEWQEFSRFIRSLRQLARGLEYVSVAEDDVILYHQSMGAAGVQPPAADSREEVSVGRQLLVSGRETIPVVTFTERVRNERGIGRSVQVALRREALAEGEQAPHTALTQMYRLSLATVSASFALCVLLVAWLINREVRREGARRRQEHLAFAGAMANGIFHDFRNPMSALRLDLQLLEREIGRAKEMRQERVTELALRARSTMDRLDDILKEFLMISRPQPALGGTADLSECVRDSLDLMSARYSRSEVRLQIELAAEPLTVAGVATSLKRAIVNLLVNAEQATPRGSRVLVRTFRERGEGVLEVLDEGPGVPRAERERIFEMFVSTKPGGMGIGLALARAAIEASGGTLGVDDAPGGGACFRARIPLRERADGRGAAEQGG